MIKIINYFFQSIIIYLFLIIGRLMGLTLSRKLFSYVFLKVAPLFKSKKRYICDLSPLLDAIIGVI